MEVQMWPIEKLIFYARNPRKNDKVVDRMVEGDGRTFDRLASERATEVWDAAA